MFTTQMYPTTAPTFSLLTLADDDQEEIPPSQLSKNLFVQSCKFSSGEEKLTLQ
jgi:hypothetical protein